MQTSLSIGFPTVTEMVFTPYFFWLLYLRSSFDYWWICQEEGRCDDERLFKVWRDFGNLFQYETIEHWWQDRGAYVFDNPQIEMNYLIPNGSQIKLLTERDLRKPHPEMICLAIPLWINSNETNSCLAQIMKNIENFGSYNPIKARYKVRKFDGKSRKTIVTAYQAYALQKCVLQSAETEEIYCWGCYEMGNHLKIGPQKKSTESGQRAKTQAVKRQKSIRSLFCQNKKAASAYIANVEIGVFPSTKQVDQLPRWTQQQKNKMAFALSTGIWQNNGWFKNEHSFMLSREKFPDNLSQTYSQNVLQRIDSLGSLWNASDSTTG